MTLPAYSIETPKFSIKKSVLIAHRLISIGCFLSSSCSDECANVHLIVVFSTFSRSTTPIGFFTNVGKLRLSTPLIT